MTKLFEHAVEAVRHLPPDMQDELARVLLQLTGEDQPIADLTPDEEAAVERSRAAAVRGEFATDAQVKAVWAKHGL